MNDDGKKTIADYDLWYKKCLHCGFDTGKSSIKSRPFCWKCGKPLVRDFSDRALKQHNKETK